MLMLMKCYFNIVGTLMCIQHFLNSLHLWPHMRISVAREWTSKFEWESYWHMNGHQCLCEHSLLSWNGFLELTWRFCFSNIRDGPCSYKTFLGKNNHPMRLCDESMAICDIILTLLCNWRARKSDGLINNGRFLLYQSKENISDMNT